MDNFDKKLFDTVTNFGPKSINKVEKQKEFENEKEIQREREPTPNLNSNKKKFQL